MQKKSNIVLKGNGVFEQIRSLFCFVFLVPTKNCMVEKYMKPSSQALTVVF